MLLLGNRSQLCTSGVYIVQYFQILLAYVYKHFKKNVWQGWIHTKNMYLLPRGNLYLLCNVSYFKKKPGIWTGFHHLQIEQRENTQLLLGRGGFNVTLCFSNFIPLLLLEEELAASGGMKPDAQGQNHSSVDVQPILGECITAGGACYGRLMKWSWWPSLHRIHFLRAHFILNHCPASTFNTAFHSRFVIVSAQCMCKTAAMLQYPWIGVVQFGPNNCTTFKRYLLW